MGPTTPIARHPSPLLALLARLPFPLNIPHGRDCPRQLLTLALRCTPAVSALPRRAPKSPSPPAESAPADVHATSPPRCPGEIAGHRSFRRVVSRKIAVAGLAGCRQPWSSTQRGCFSPCTSISLLRCFTSGAKIARLLRACFPPFSRSPCLLQALQIIMFL